MSVLNEQSKRPSLLAKIFGLTMNGKKPAADKTFITTTDGAAVVNFDELIKDSDFQKSAADVREFLEKNVKTSTNGSHPKL